MKRKQASVKEISAELFTVGIFLLSGAILIVWQSHPWIVVWLALSVGVALCGLVVNRSSRFAEKPSAQPSENKAVTSSASSLSHSPEKILAGKIDALDWYQFEKLLAVVYEQQGFNVTRKGGARADGGIDLILEKAGIKTAVQCKHWKKWQFRTKDIREFLGALTDQKFERGIVVTSTAITDEAKLLAQKHQIEWLEKANLIKVLEELNWTQNPELFKAMDEKKKSCPQCDHPMIWRSGRNNPSYHFWGCSAYPKCRFTFHPKG